MDKGEGAKKSKNFTDIISGSSLGQQDRGDRRRADRDAGAGKSGLAELLKL